MKQIRNYVTRLLCLVLMLSMTPVTLHAETDEIPDSYTLEEVVVLSRHNIRAPLSTTGSALDQATPYTWTNWSSNASELSLRGGLLETAMGQYFRKWLESEELIPENYQPEGEEVRFYANAKQRTIATAQYFSSGFLPVANVRIITKQTYDKMDPVFEPKLTFVNEEYAEDAKRQMAEKEKDLTKEYELLSEVIGYQESDGYKDGTYKDLKTGDNTYNLEVGKEPGTSGSLRTGTTLADALVLQYYEVADKTEAAFGHELSDADWASISRIKDTYNDVLFTAPLIAKNVAHPLLEEIDAELDRDDRKFSFLCGHDSNIGSVLAALDVMPYSLPEAIETNTPIGSKVVFEKWKDEAGKEYIRVRMVYQSVDQLRTMPILNLENTPMSYTLSFDGLTANDDGLIPMEAFDAHMQECIDAYDEIRNTYHIEKTSVVPNTADCG